MSSDQAAALVADAPAQPPKAFVTSARLSLPHACGADRGGDPDRRSAGDGRGAGLDELRAHALNNIGVAKGAMGDLSGLDDLRRSIAISSSSNSPESRRGLNNLASLLRQLGDLAPPSALFTEALTVAQRFGVVTDVLWVRAELASLAFEAGRWDEAAAAVEELIAEFAQGVPTTWRLLVATIGLGSVSARGDVAAPSTTRSRSSSSRNGSRIRKSSTRLVRAWLESCRMRVARPTRTLRCSRYSRKSGRKGATACWLIGCSTSPSSWPQRVGDGLPRAAADARTSTRWADAATPWAQGEYERAADVLNEIGALPTRRLHASERRRRSSLPVAARRLTSSSAARWRSSARSARPATSVRARRCSPHPHDARLPFLWAREP